MIRAQVRIKLENCVWRGERAYRPNDVNNFNEAEIEVLIEYLCTSWASWLYVYYLYFVRLKMFIYNSDLNNRAIFPFCWCNRNDISEDFCMNTRMAYALSNTVECVTYFSVQHHPTTSSRTFPWNFFDNLHEIMRLHSKLCQHLHLCPFKVDLVTNRYGPPSIAGSGKCSGNLHNWKNPSCDSYIFSRKR